MCMCCIVLTLIPVTWHFDFASGLSIIRTDTQTQNFEDCQLSASCISELHKLNITGSSLTGTIPSFLGSLRSLSELRLVQVHLSGTLPSSLSSLTLLNRVEIVEAGLTGSMDPILGTGSILTSSNLSSNSFSTTDLSISLIESLTSLEHFNVSNNDVSVDIKAFCALRHSLQSLDVSWNALVGDVDALYCANTNESTVWPQLRHLDASFNQLTGVFPNRIQPPALVNKVWPGQNFVSNEVFPTLELINLAGNRLEIALHRLFCSQTLDFNSTYLFSGRAGGNFAFCDGLATDEAGCYFPNSSQAGWVYGDMMNGRYTQSLSTCGNDAQFSRSNTSGNVCTLDDLDSDGLWDNCSVSSACTCANCSSVGGGICQAFTNTSCFTLWDVLEATDYVNASGHLSRPCKNHDPVPINCANSGNVCSNTQLPTCASTAFSLCAAPFCGSIANSNVSGGVWSSSMWDGYGDGTDADSDGFNSTFAQFMCSNVTALQWNNNWLTGSLPAVLGSVSTLQFLDLSQNSFSGILPLSIQSLSTLRNISLRDNHFSGPLPFLWDPEFGPIRSVGLEELTHFDISRNNITGGVPSTIQYLTSLRSLHVAHNPLGGMISPALGSLSSLRVLNARRSGLVGTLPQSLGMLRNLTQLDLSSTFLSGQLPLALASLSRLETLDISDMSKMAHWDLSSHMCRLFWSATMESCNLDDRTSVYCSQTSSPNWDSNCTSSLRNLCGFDFSNCKEISNCTEAFRLCYGKQYMPSSNSNADLHYDLGVCDLSVCVTNGIKFELRSHFAVDADGWLGTVGFCSGAVS